ncbi:hypothetical protein U1Q18_043417 [Sarracenia purpurea var. burkii]
MIMHELYHQWPDWVKDYFILITCSWRWQCLWRRQRRRPLSLLLLVADSSGSGLQIADFTKIKSHHSSAKWVCFRLASVFFEGGAEAADEGVEAAPSLSERAGARRRRVWVAEEGAKLGVDFGLSELVEVSKEFEDVGTAAAGERERRQVISEVLAEGVPVPALLVLVSAKSGWRIRRRRKRS